MDENKTLDEWKIILNNMLWSTCPGSMTLNEAEAMACEMLEVVRGHLNNHGKPFNS